MEKIKIITIFILFLFITTTAWASKIVAFINNEVVTEYDLTAYVSMTRLQLEEMYSGKELEKNIQNLKSEALNSLIEDKLIISLARQRGLMIRPEFIQQRIDGIRNRFPNEAEFKKHLIKSGFSQDDLYKRIEEQLITMELINQEVRSRIYISPRAITEYYTKHSHEFKKPQLREVLAIRLESKQQASRAMSLLNTKISFSKVQKEFNSEINLGLMDMKMIKKDLAEVIFSLKENEFSKPIKQDDGFYIFYIQRIEPERNFILKEAQAQIRDILWHEEMEVKLTEWLDKLKAKSKIIINE